MLKKNKKRIIAILGPTAAGKTKLAIKLAYKFNSEIVSADSRQVYKGMDVGTGKDLEDYQINPESKKHKNVKIPYHLIDVVSPKTEFNLAKYQKLAYGAIDDILSRGKLPFLVGGSGLYLQAIIDGYNLSSARPDKKLRAALEKLSADELFARLQKINPDFANRLNNSDKKNSRRLIRHIESVKQNKGKQFKKNRMSEPKYSSLIFGLTLPKDELNKKIDQRMEKWLDRENLLGEVENLRNSGVSWKRLNEFGLEYRWANNFLRNKIEFQEMKKFLSRDLKKFAKRQLSWFRRWEKQGIKIHWIKSDKEAKKIIKKFILTKK